MIREVIWVTAGDSKDPANWSNVPYLFARTLESKGIIVHRVHYNPTKFIKKLYTHIAYKIHCITKSDSFRGIVYSTTGCLIAFPKILFAILKYRKSDCCIFMGAGYANFWTKMPSVMFMERSFEKKIKDEYHRELTMLEKLVAYRENFAWKKSSFISILFPRDIDFVKSKVPNVNIKYKGSNVINSFFKGTLNDDIIKQKQKSLHILFIGGSHYKDGAKMLIEAFKILKSEIHSLELDIIGLNDNDINEHIDGVNFYGYLRKDVSEENTLYYELLEKAKVYVNPTPAWGAYSSCIEAMYFYTPCVIHPYEHFVSEFGYNIEFGKYNQVYSPFELAKDIKEILISNRYASMSKKAHDVVKDYSWDSYIEWFLNETENAIIKRK